MKTPVSTQAAIRAALASEGVLEHAAAIIAAARARGVRLNDGSVYPALVAMRAAGEIEETKHPQWSWRTALRLTAKGAQLAAHERRAVAALYGLTDPRAATMPVRDAKEIVRVAGAARRARLKKKSGRAPARRDRRRAA